MTLDSLADDQLALLKRMGRHLRAWRKHAGCTQQEVADHLEVSRATIANIEAGRSNISVTRLYDFSLFYGCAVGDLLA